MLLSYSGKSLKELIILIRISSDAFLRIEKSSYFKNNLILILKKTSENHVPMLEKDCDYLVFEFGGAANNRLKIEE